MARTYRGLSRISNREFQENRGANAVLALASERDLGVRCHPRRRPRMRFAGPMAHREEQDRPCQEALTDQQKRVLQLAAQVHDFNSLLSPLLERLAPLLRPQH